MNDDRDMSKEAVLKRYKIANEMAIASHSRTVFQALMDIPRLLDKIEKLEEKIKLTQDSADN